VKIHKKLASVAAVLALMSMPALAQSYSWPNNIPPDAKALMAPLPLTPTGQVVPGYPDGAPASPPDVLTFTPDQITKLKAGNYTAGIVMHTMAAGWPLLQVQGIKQTLAQYGIKVVAVTDAKFQPGTQIGDLEEMVARKPSVIFSIPIDPKSESAAYEKAAAAGIKLVFMDNVPVGMAPGKDYVSVTASDNEKNAYFAAKQLADSMGGKGEVGVITLVYDYYYSVAVRKVGALKAFFVAWDTPAEQVAAAAQTLGRKVTITTNDLAPDSALFVARGQFLAVGSQRPFDQGVAEANSAATALLGEKVPPYIEVPTLRVKKLNLLSALQTVTHQPPPKNVINACNGGCF
jgi:ribose transport system substrate-binding protein